MWTKTLSLIKCQCEKQKYFSYNQQLVCKLLSCFIKDGTSDVQCILFAHGAFIITWNWWMFLTCQWNVRVQKKKTIF